MRHSNVLDRMVAGTCLIAATVVPTATSAQSFFQALLGGGSPKPVPQVRVIPPASLGVWRGAQSPWGPAPRHHGGARQGHQGGSSGQGGGYRTVCVRLCDGYYWPISASVSRSKFYRDSQICRSSCGAETKLYYQGSDEGDAKSLVDLQGRAYSRLDTAFLYRKTLVADCACKHAPWSEVELERHQRYAMTEGAMHPASTRVTSGEAVVLAGGAPASEPGKSVTVVANVQAPVAPVPTATPAAFVASVAPFAAGASKPAPAPSVVGAGPAPPAVQPIAVNVAKVPEKPVEALARPVEPAPVSGPEKIAETAVTATHEIPADRKSEQAAERPVPIVGRHATKAKARIAVHAAPTRAQHAATATPAKTRLAAKATSAKPKPVQSASLFAGQQKLVWPGDAPSKYR